MAIANYTDLQAAVIEWLHRDGDTAFAARVPDFIAMAESRANGHLKARAMELRSTLACVAGNAFVTLPTDMLEMRRLTVSSTNPVQTLKYVTPDELTHDYSYTTSGVPYVFAVIGSTVQLAPTPDQAYSLELSYMQKIPALASNSTNWLLTAYPDVYLYGALIQAATYVQDFSILNTLQTLYRDAVENMNAIDWYSGSTMSVRAS